MSKTLNDWVKTGNCFVKKMEEQVFHVIRIEEGMESLHYEHYFKVDLKDVKEDDFSTFGIGSLSEFLAEKTDEEKAAYLAFHAYHYDISGSYDSEVEIAEALIEDGVIPREETFKIA